MDWLRARPLLHRSPAGLLVHAGLLPDWSLEDAEAWARRLEAALGDAVRSVPLLERRPAAAAGEEEPELRRALEAMTRLRTLDASGRPCRFTGRPDEAPPGCVPWFDAPGRRSAGKLVVCGHWAALGLVLRPDLVTLDTGCAWGGELTAVRLEDRRVAAVGRRD